MPTKNNQNFFIPVFRLPFRPFFLAAGIFSTLIIALWGLYWSGSFILKPQGGIIWWHGHEMLFGFSGAVLVGFLLTAAKNWTGLPGMGGWPLVTLFLFWVCARASLFFHHEIALVTACIFEAVFWGYACLIYSIMIIRTKLWTNIGFSIVLIGMGSFSILSILSTISGEHLIDYLHTAVAFFILVITVIGGRIIPFFTASATKTEKVKPNPIIELMTIILCIILLAWTIIYGLAKTNQFLGTGLLFLVLMQIIRVARWPIRLSLRNPMLWSLYLGYGALIMGLALLASYHYGFINNVSAAIHTITLGTIGLMILTMMSRVSMGHTGRAIIASNLLVLAFILIFVAMLIRVFIPLFGFQQYLMLAYAVSAGLWVIAFSIWLVKFFPILTRARTDGLPG
ncbi:NnrS family protein [Aliikangiella maris]|uniref:NnrS family protein n=2 Tax=Aliikangiella maris TaxID=3162458 RepID=A0ABV2BPR6_9GAMM